MFLVASIVNMLNHMRCIKLEVGYSGKQEDPKLDSDSRFSADSTVTGTIMILAPFVSLLLEIAMISHLQLHNFYPRIIS